MLFIAVAVCSPSFSAARNVLAQMKQSPKGSLVSSNWAHRTNSATYDRHTPTLCAASCNISSLSRNQVLVAGWWPYRGSRRFAIKL